MSILRTAALAVLVSWLAAVPAQASEALQRQHEIAALELEIAGLERLAAQLGHERAFHDGRGARGNQSAEDVARLTAEMQAERERLTEQMVDLRQLAEYAALRRDDVRRAREELQRYTEQLALVQRQNVVKTAITLGLATAQEVMAFATTSGKIHEIGAWVADKIAGEAVKKALSGGDEYYTRRLQRLSASTRAVVPELEELGRLSGQTIEFWQSYLRVREDKDISGSNATILAKGRILLDLAARAATRLEALDKELDDTARGAEEEIERRHNRIAELIGVARALEQGAAEAAQLIEAARAEQARVAAEHAAVDARLAALRQRLEALRAAPVAAPAQLSDIDAQMNRYRGLLANWQRDHPGFAEQAQRLRAAMEALEATLAAFAETSARHLQARDERIRDSVGRPIYPYGDVADSEKLVAYMDYHRAMLRLREVQLPELRSSVDAVATEYDRIGELLVRAPFDASSEGIVHAELSAARNGAAQLLTRERLRLERELRAVLYSQRDALQRQLQRVVERERELAALHASEPAPAYGVNGALAVQARQILERQRRAVAGLRNAVAAAEAEIDHERAALPERIRAIEREIAGQREGYRLAAQDYIAQAQDHRAAIDREVTEKAALLAFFRRLTAQGVLSESSSMGAHDVPLFNVSRTWISTATAGLPRNCAAVEAVHGVLLPLAEESQRLLARLNSASQAAVHGPGSAPLSRWSELNEPLLHARVTEIARGVDEARARRDGTRVYPRDPISPFLQGLLGGVVMMEHFNDIIRGMSESQNRIASALAINIAHAGRLAADERIPADAVPAMREQLKRLTALYESELSCLGDDFLANGEIIDRLGQLKTLTERLAGKATYADASALIAAAQGLMQRLEGLGMGHDEAYRAELAAMQAEFDSLAAASSQGNRLAPGDARDLAALVGRIEPLLEQHLAHSRSPQGAPRISDEQVRMLYQSFIDAYARGDVRALLGLLAPDWQGGDGADLRDVEDYLSNSFRVFERIQYRISGFQVLASSSDGSVRVGYSVRIVGENRRQRMNHEESSRVVEEVGLIDGQPRILRTLSGTQWLR